jgi:PhzF family phenazine biosynthesis protein
MELPIYQVDAFARQVFKGNPAAVLPLSQWLDDASLQAIAMENNLSDTAYVVARGDPDEGYELRWFTPTMEVDLCGHATLAAAHVLFEHLEYSGREILFYTHSGELRVRRAEAGLTLDFPAAQLGSADVDLAVCEALGAIASEAVIATDNPFAVVYVYEFEQDVAALQPNFAALQAASQYCIIATAPGDNCDFVSRFFGPQIGVNEDPVTGSAHCSLVPYWAQRLHLQALQARQISTRGGELACELRDGRVFMTGAAVTFLQGRVMWDQIDG